MRIFKYLLPILSIRSDPLKSVGSETDDLFGPYQYKVYSLDDCQLDKKKETEIYKCKYTPASADNIECPDGPEGCTNESSSPDGDGAYGYFCSYMCPTVISELTETTTDDKNLVMIICTSIFVPLGVVGIAAGVYFFFFHESSEVAPVENDDEISSTKHSEHNPTEEDKEERHSEISKDN
ncbi:unnamed protein product [Oikopleura dioica]|uniref:Uncharacterized protein n=1 Tax=Oikopleura dioica TaxID=34765 RepID=E4X2F7_OIKDI|nr:unnamed protein product [Oikopleura dioica]